jgi:ATP-dependent Clp protease protease subunit
MFTLEDIEVSSKLRRDDIQIYFDYDLHIGARRIYLGRPSRVHDGECDTDNTLASNLIKSLNILNEISQDPIFIDINNSGGDVSHGMAIVDAIKASDSHVTITVYGQASSMGSIILQAGDSRIMTPHSHMLIHYGETSLSTTSHSIKNYARHEEITNRKVEDIYLDQIKKVRPRFTRKQLQNLLIQDTLLTANEALELGLCNRISE